MARPDRRKAKTQPACSYHDRILETLPRRDLDRLKLHLFKRTVRYAQEHSAHYRAVLKDVKFELKDVRTLEDISLVPVLSRFELAFSQSSWPPFGDMLCVDPFAVSTTVMTSGTMGRPLLVPLTENDTMHYFAPDSELWRRAIHPLGHRKDDVFQSTWGHALDTWAVSSLSFTRRRPCTPFVITGDVPVEQQLTAMSRLRTTVLITNVRMCNELGKHLSELPKNVLNSIRLRAIIVSGAPGRKDLGQLNIDGREITILELAFAAEAGLIGAGCRSCDGLHVPEDHLLVEVLADGGVSVAPGEKGELVVTTLRREAMPLIRYRIGDVTAMEPEPCPCGRTHVRIKGLLGKFGPRHMIDAPNANGPVMDH